MVLYLQEEKQRMKTTKMLLYCTKGEPYLYKKSNNEFCLSNKSSVLDNLNGKIVAECEVEVEKIIHSYHYEPEVDIGIAVLPSFVCDTYVIDGLDEFQSIQELCYKSCMSDYDLDGYLRQEDGYALHIRNLAIFDDPKQLNDFMHYRQIRNNVSVFENISQAPQNMMRVENAYGDVEFILISIKPKWLCKILNGEKTIEVRKKILKEML